MTVTEDDRRKFWANADGERTGGRVAMPRPVRRKPNGKPIVDYTKPDGSYGTRTFDDDAEALRFRNQAWADFLAGGSKKARECLTRGLTVAAVNDVADFPDEDEPKPAKKANGKHHPATVNHTEAPPIAATLPELGVGIKVVGLFLDDNDEPKMMLRGEGRTWLVAVEGRAG